jgi:transposase
MIVLLEDECHLLWGDVCGYAWSQRNLAVGVPVLNQRQRQTYYGALNLVTGKVHLDAYDAGNGGNTVAYLQACQRRYPNKKLLWLWDGASYHRGEAVKAFLTHENAGLQEADWKVTCLRFAPNAPDQNPVEDVWLKGKNHLRKHFSTNKTFANVKQCFSDFLGSLTFLPEKLKWYWPNTQLT